MAESISPNLPTSHPLILELSSLRTQLAQYQHAAHTTGIQLQGARLETALAKEKEEGVKRWGEGLRKEAEVLRANPSPPAIPPTSTALTELSFAHRRLSSKLDFTEEQLSSTALQLARAQQDVQRLLMERESDRAAINELKRIEDDREEEVEWERGERRKIEEQKKLVDLALQEYKGLVQQLDPNAVPPAVPSKATSPFFQTPSQGPDGEGNPQEPAGGDYLSVPFRSSEPSSSSDAISNLLIGQRGVQQLFQDFNASLTSKDREIGALRIQIESLEYSLSAVKTQLSEETSKRVEAEGEVDKKDRDDKSAAHVVERYMTFTQKTHATVHMHLNNLRTRSQATVTSLRHELSTVRLSLAAERERSAKLRAALDELSEGMSRESAGRRREVTLRLKMIAQEEKKARRVESWLDKVRRLRDGVEGAVLKADILDSLLDEGIEAVKEQGEDSVEDKQKGWTGIVPNIGRKKKGTFSFGKERNPADESLARALLAEELVTTLVQDLQLETERRMELEKQRVEWLAKEAAEGIQAQEEGEGQVMFDMENDEISDEEKAEDKLEESAVEAEQPEKDVASIETTSPEPSPLVFKLKSQFEPLTMRYNPLQKTLHDLSHSLSSLRTSLPESQPPTPSAKTNKKSSFLPLARMPASNSGASQLSTRSTLFTLLDALHEVIEDARVDVEIALADTERVYRGFEALLNVNHPSASSQETGEKQNVMDEVNEYVEAKEDGTVWKRLNKKVSDIENDLAGMKRVAHELEGMDVASPVDGEETQDDAKADEDKNIWHGVQLRTVSLQPQQPSALPTPLVSPSDNEEQYFPQAQIFGSTLPSKDLEPRRRAGNMFSSVGNVGRSFSAGVMGAPRRVSGAVGGLYRGPVRDKEDVKKIEEDEVDE